MLFQRFSICNTTDDGFVCGNGQCILKENVCNDVLDCSDGSDEDHLFCRTEWYD